MPRVDLVNLRRRFLALLGHGAADAGGVVFDRLDVAYGEAGRHYHTLRHIGDLLALVDDEAEHFGNRRAVELAVFFHDAVYDTRRSDNEAASAALAEEALAGLGVDGETSAAVSRLIEATAHFSASADRDDADACRFLDLDIAILAAPADGYDRYALAVRREYAALSDDAWRHGRARVLRHFLARGRLYLCDDHAAAWDAAARSNMARELAGLEAT